MHISPYLHYNGNCEAAFKFYEKTLGAKIVFKMTWGESPMAKDSPPNQANKIMHAAIEIGDETLSGGDCPPDRFEKPQGAWIMLDCKTPEEADRVFHAFSAEGKVTMPISETFWAKRFGMVIDQFGTPWMVNCGKEM